MTISERVNKIHMMSRGKQRDLEIHYLFHYLLYLEDLGKITTDDLNRIYGEVNYRTNVKSISDRELDYSLLELTCLYEEALKYTNNHKLFVIKPEINYQEFLSYTIDFFKYIDINAYKLFMDMRNSKSILLLRNFRDNASGSAYNIGPGKSKILIEDIGPFDNIIDLIHEMGHAYYNYLEQTAPVYKNNFIDIETISITFEFLFMSFLRKNHLCKSEIIDASERYIYAHLIIWMNNAYIFNNLAIDQKIRGYDELTKIYYQLDTDTYTSLSALNTPKYVTEHCKNRISFCHNNYGYGLLFAILLQDIFSKDEKEALTIIKTLPSFVNTHQYGELIGRFSDDEYLEAHKQFVDRVLSKTYYKTNKK